jgi:uncharacterized protein
LFVSIYFFTAQNYFFIAQIYIFIAQNGDFFYRCQVVAHLAPNGCGRKQTSTVDDHQVPGRHFGAVLSTPQWQAMATKLKAIGTKFVNEPYTLAQGEAGEFFMDPFGNAIEFKAFANMSALFAK